MLNKFNQDEKGLTLIELLAAIVILGLVTTLASVMIVSSINSKDTTQDNISLKQDTNVLINDLRRQFHENDGKTEICFNHKANGLVVDTNKTEVLNRTVDIDEYCIKNIDKKESLEINLVTKNKSEKPLEIKTTFISNGGGTSITMGGEKVCIIPSPDLPPKPKPVIISSPEKAPDSNPKDLEVIDSEGGITLYHNVKELPCNSKDLLNKLNTKRAEENKKLITILNIRWNAEKVEQNCEGNTHLIKHNLDIYKKLQNHRNLNLQVDQNLYTRGIETFGDSNFNVLGNFYTEQMDTSGNSTFIVDGNIQTEQLETNKNGNRNGNTKFEAGGNIYTGDLETNKTGNRNGDTEFKAGGNIYTEDLETNKNGNGNGNTKFEAGGNIYTGDLETNKTGNGNGHTEFKTGGDLRTKQLKTNGSGPDTFDIGGNLYTDQFKIKGENTFTVKNNAILNDEVDMEEGKNKLIIDGSAEVHKQIEIKGSNNMMSVGNCMNFVKASLDLENNSTLNIDGDAKFDKEIEIDNNSTLIIGQHAVFKDQVDIDFKSKLTIGQHAIFKDQVDIEDDSSVIIGNDTNGGDAYFKDQFDLSSNSKLTVWGNIDFGSGKNIKINGTLCSGGIITPSEYANKVTCKP